MRRLNSTALGAIACVAMVATGATASKADPAFQRLYAFGDSYVDNNNWANLAFAGGSLYPSHQVVPPTGMFNYFYFQTLANQFKAIQGFSDAAYTNYAISGATATNANYLTVGLGIPNLFGLSGEIDRFVASGGRFASGDLVLLSDGLNEAYIGLQGAPSQALATQLAGQTVQNVTTDITRLVSAGARTIAFAGFSDATVLPDLNGKVGNPGALSVYSAAYFNGLQMALAPIARSGVNIFLFDETRMIKQIQANPSAYQIADPFTVCLTTPNCANAQQSYLINDGTHLTSAGFAIEAQYIANLLQAPRLISAQMAANAFAIDRFETSLSQRLEASRYLAEPGSVSARASQVSMSGTSPISVFIDGFYGTSSPGPFVNHAEQDGGMVGFAYRYRNEFRAGAALSLMSADASLADALSHSKLTSSQIGAYASWTYPNWFADLLATSGWNSYAFDRQGVVGPVSANPEGHGFTVSARSGYLFDLSVVRLGPIANLRFARSSIDSFTETGDPLLTFQVGGQRLDSLVGGVGGQLRVPLRLGDRTASAYVNLTAEHEFLGGPSILSLSETQAPMLPILFSMGGTRVATYGKVEGGLGVALSPNASGSFNASSTFGRDGGSDLGFSGALKLTF
jgi:outer membrane lipase/esterase